MLERLVRRLNSRGSNRFVSLASRSTEPSSPAPSSQQPPYLRYRSRRMLHSAFWVHGAVTLDVSSYFFGANHTDEYPDEVPVRPNQQQQQKQQAETKQSSEPVDLDFLYPPPALALIRRVSSRLIQTTAAARRSDSISPTAILLRYCRRLYSSASAQDATDAQTKAAERHGTLKQLVRQSIPYDPDVNAEEQYPTFEMLMSNRKPDFYDLAWQLYNKELSQTWSKFDAKRRRNILLKYLSLSSRQIDLERCLKLGNSITLEELDKYSCRSLVYVLLKLNNVSGALELLQAFATIHRKIKLCGFEDFLSHTLRGGNYDQMVKLWGSIMGREGDMSAFMVLNSDQQAPGAFLDWLQATEKQSSRTERAASLAKFLWKGALSSLSLPKEEVTHVRYGTYREITKVMEARNLVDDFDHVQRTILDCLNNQKHLEAIELYESHRKKTNRIIYNELLNGLLKAYVQTKNFDGVKLIFEDFYDFGIRPDEMSYGIVMKAFAVDGETGVVDQLLAQYLGNFDLNPHICACVLRSRVMRGEMGAALEFLNEAESKGVEPDLNCFNTMMVGYSWSRNMPGMLDILKRVLNAGLKPNRVTYGALMYICAFRADVQNTKFLMRLAELSGEVSLTMYNFLVMAHVKVGGMQMAERVTNYYESIAGSSKSVHIYNSLLEGYASRRWEEGFNKALKHMQGEGIEFDLHTYSLHIWGLCRTRNYERARAVLDSIPEKLKLNNVPFNILITSLIKQRRYADVWPLYEDMVNRGIHPSYATYTLLIQNSILEARMHLGERAEPEQIVARGRAILQIVKMRRPGADLLSRYPIKSALPPSVFVPIMNTMLQAGRSEAVSQEYDAFLKLAEEQTPDGAYPDRMILTPLLMACVRLHRWSVVRDAWQRLKAYAVGVGQKLPIAEAKVDVLNYRAMMLTPQFSMLIDAAVSGPDEALPGEEPPITLEEIKTEKKALWDLGFMMDNKNWNDYICCRAQFGELLQACMDCEKYLMKGWLWRSKVSVSAVPGAWRLRTVRRKARYFAYSSTIRVLAAEMVRLQERMGVKEKDVEVEAEKQWVAPEPETKDDTSKEGSTTTTEETVTVNKDEDPSPPDPAASKDLNPSGNPTTGEDDPTIHIPETPSALFEAIKEHAPLTYGACSAVPNQTEMAEEQLQRRLAQKSRFRPWRYDDPPTAEDLQPVNDTYRGTIFSPKWTATEEQMMEEDGSGSEDDTEDDNRGEEK